MSLITITKGPGIYSRQKTDENGERLTEREDIEYGAETYHVSKDKSMWLIDSEMFSIRESEDKDASMSVMQGENIICKGVIIKTNF